MELRMFQRKVATSCVLAVVLLVFLFALSQLWQLGAVVAVAVLLIAELLVVAVRNAYTVQAWLLVAVQAVIVLGGICGLVVLLDQRLGAWQVLALAAVVSVNDIVAQLFGRRHGTPGTFFPKFSPSKSREGAVMGLCVGYLAALFLIATAGLSGHAFGVGTMGALVVAPFVATAGDLLESATKRALGVKDFANYLPGIGGLMDRLDSWLPMFALAALGTVWFP